MTNTTCHLPQWITYPERQIIARIVTEAICRNLTVSIYDGEEWTVIAATDRKTIEQGIGQTDTTTLRIRNPKDRDERTNRPKTIGSVLLVHGNGSDVIADHTDTPEMEALLKPAMEIAETFSAAGV